MFDFRQQYTSKTQIISITYMVAALKKLCILRGVCVGTKGLFFDSNFTGLPNAKFFFVIEL